VRSAATKSALMSRLRVAPEKPSTKARSVCVFDSSHDRFENSASRELAFRPGARPVSNRGSKSDCGAGCGASPSISNPSMLQIGFLKMEFCLPERVQLSDVTRELDGLQAEDVANTNLINVVGHAFKISPPREMAALFAHPKPRSSFPLFRFCFDKSFF
jgi:hypothetical protein